MYFIEKLIQGIKEKKCVVCMGLDPTIGGEGQIPKHLVDQYEEPNKIILEFNKELIDHTHELIPIIKPQIAFYEKYEASIALKDTINYAHKKNLLVILDAKRNDIGTTSEAYASSCFDVYKADACTLNAYLGFDSIQPFLKYRERGIFVLVKTSNPSSKDFQDLFSVRLDYVPNTITEIEQPSLKLERNYIHMAKLVKEWGKDLQKFSDFYNLGAVVGATHPNELIAVRHILLNSFILMPGYGAQGAEAKDVKHGFLKNAMGGIVNSSRGIMFAYKNKKMPSEKFGEAARKEILEMNQKINKELGI